MTESLHFPPPVMEFLSDWVELGGGEEGVDVGDPGATHSL